MDLREKIAEAIFKHGRPHGDWATYNDQGNHLACADAVMKVVEAETKKLREENSRLRALEAASRTIRVLSAEKDQKIIERGKRVRALEDENKRMRDTIASRIVEEERSVQRKILKDPTNPSLAGLLVGLQRSRDIVTSRAREIAEEAARPGSCSHVASGLLLDGSTCARPIGHTGDHSDHKGGMWENMREEA